MSTETDHEDPRPLTAGVCGHPIAQSKSPRLFRHWLDVFGIEGHYAPLLVEPSGFDTAIRGVQAAGYRGVNCTLPHKEAALATADEVSDAARDIGAANTLTFLPDGRIHADNTDAFGFIENMRAGAPHWDAATGPAVMIGAGGAARAGVFALIEAGAPEIRITNRTGEKAEMLARHFAGKGLIVVVDWADRADALDGAATIANSTSLGMVGNPPLDISLDAAPRTALVTDMVYNPLTTPLLAAAQARGMPTVDGLGMLLHQARPGFHRWFGRDPQVTDALRAACLGGPP
ncbi:MAG: shikimate dehydrogenase [Pseudomonadota bacterium]